MKKIVLMIAAAALMTSCLGIMNFKIVRGDGIPGSKTFDELKFDGIGIRGSMDIIYHQVPGSGSAVLYTDQNLLNDYEIVPINGVLEVSTFDGVSPIPKTKTYVDAASPNLRSVKISGSGSCEIADNLTTSDDFYFVLSGSGSLKADTIVCDNFSAKISGSGNIKVHSLTADDISIEITGSGNTEIICRDAGDIDVRISGSGNVHLSGNARSLNTKITGSGNINTRNLALSGK